MWMLNRVSQQSPKKHEGLLHLSIKLCMNNLPRLKPATSRHRSKEETGNIQAQKCRDVMGRGDHRSIHPDPSGHTAFPWDFCSNSKLRPLLQSQPCRVLSVKRKSWEVLWVPVAWPSGCPAMDQVLDQERWLPALEGWECLW